MCPGAGLICDSFACFIFNDLASFKEYNLDIFWNVLIDALECRPSPVQQSSSTVNVELASGREPPPTVHERNGGRAFPHSALIYDPHITVER